MVDLIPKCELQVLYDEKNNIGRKLKINEEEWDLFFKVDLDVIVGDVIYDYLSDIFDPHLFKTGWKRLSEMKDYLEKSLIKENLVEIQNNPESAQRLKHFVDGILSEVGFTNVDFEVQYFTKLKHIEHQKKKKIVARY